MGGWSFFLEAVRFRLYVVYSLLGIYIKVIFPPSSPLLIHLSPSLSIFLSSYLLHQHISIHYGKSRSHRVYLHALCLDYRVINLHHYGGIGLHKSQFFDVEQFILHSCK